MGAGCSDGGRDNSEVPSSNVCPSEHSKPVTNGPSCYIMCPLGSSQHIGDKGIVPPCRSGAHGPFVLGAQFGTVGVQMARVPHIAWQLYNMSDRPHRHIDESIQAYCGWV